MLFGWKVHRTFEKGLSVERDAAKECRAWLHDKATGRPVAMLWWRGPMDGASDWRQDVDIDSGEGYDLMLLARLESEPLKYFPFALQGSARDSEISVPS